MATNDDSLVVDNIGLAYKLAWEYYQKFNGFIELEELQSLCFIGLTKASNMYNENKNYAFSTYAYKCMQNEVLNYFNKVKDTGKNISLSQELGDDFYLEDTLSSVENIEEDIERTMMIDKLYKFISELTEVEQKVVLGHLQNKTTSQLEEIVGLKKARIAVIYRKAINKLRVRFYRDRREEDEST